MDTVKAGELNSLLAGMNLPPTIATHQKQQTMPVTGADSRTLSLTPAVSGRSSLAHCTIFLGQNFSFLTLKQHLRSSLSQGTYGCVKAQIFRLPSVPMCLCRSQQTIGTALTAHLFCNSASVHLSASNCRYLRNFQAILNQTWRVRNARNQEVELLLLSWIYRPRCRMCRIQTCCKIRETMFTFKENYGVSVHRSGWPSSNQNGEGQMISVLRGA